MLRKIIALFFILALATQTLPIQATNYLMKGVCGTLAEDLNENGSCGSSSIQEIEHKKLIVHYYDFSFTLAEVTKDLPNEGCYVQPRILSPHTEVLKEPPSSLI